jgi:hypothetical protein
MESGFTGRQAILIYGFEDPQRPLHWLIEAFEAVAARGSFWAHDRNHPFVNWCNLCARPVASSPGRSWQVPRGQQDLRSGPEGEPPCRTVAHEIRLPRSRMAAVLARAWHGYGVVNVQSPTCKLALPRSGRIATPPVQHLEQQQSRLRQAFGGRFEGCLCVHGRQFIVPPKFGTKRSWVQIPPPRPRSEPYCDLS